MPPCTPRIHSPFSRFYRVFCALAALLVALAWAAPARAQVVATYDFEDGTAEGWSSFYGATTPTNSTAEAYSGTHSLLTSTSSSGTGGPQISLSSVLQAGAKYTITGWVRLGSGFATGNANFTIQRSDPTCSGGTCYDTIGSYETGVTDGGWAQIGGAYTASSTETAMTLYAQLVGATSATPFYLDAVVITQTAPPPGGAPVASYTFANGTDGWFPFGSPTLASVVSPFADPNGNAHSLLTTNRTASYMGPGLNLLNVNGLEAGATYQISAYVLLANSDSNGPTVSLSTATDNCANPNGSYGTVATSAALSTSAWTKVQGTFSYSNQPGPPTQLTLYLQSTSATDSFYVSDVVISELAPPPLSPSQQDNTGISTNFEDGGVDGWSSRTGNSTVANSAATGYNSAHSLLTTGRSANYDGPQISVSNKMYVGSVYNISTWIKLVPTDGSTHIINMSLQTSLSGNVSYNSVTGYPGVSIPADGAWHQISVNGYNMANAYDQGQAFLYLQTVPSSGNDLVSFYIDDFQLTYVQPPTPQTGIPAIKDVFADLWHVGAAIDTSDLQGPHEQLLTTHFNSMTPGNDLKWSSVEATKGSYNYANGDAEVGVAVCHDMLVRGQNLVWATGAQTPAYATGDGTNSATNQAAVTANIQEHIQSETQHFGKNVYAWDVVNEPIDSSQPDCLVHGPFYQVLGKSYLDVAFKAARQYAPAGTKLFLNDYNTDQPAKLACLIQVVKDMQSRGVPIDGIGHESHLSINYPSLTNIDNAVETVAAELPALDQQITELDISVYNAGDTAANYGANVPASVLAEQGWFYARFFGLLKNQWVGKIKAVTIWGMADDDTWLDSFPVVRTDYPLPFDMNLQAKPAYWGIVDPSHLPGYGLEFTLNQLPAPFAQYGPSHPTARTFNLTAKNGDVGPAYATEVTGITVQQISGAACSPTVSTLKGFPIQFGDVAANASSSVQITISGCESTAGFRVTGTWDSSVYHAGTFESVFGPTL